jgi:hypothetical protein
VKQPRTTDTEILITWVIVILMGVLAIWLVLPRQARAQELPTATKKTQVVVTLRDANGNGVPGALVVIQNSLTKAAEAQASTDAVGTAMLHDVPSGEKRLFVQGILADRTPLQHDAFDTGGILLFVGGSALQVDLVIEPSGVIVISPEMISSDSPLDAFPVATSEAHLSATSTQTPTSIPLLTSISAPQSTERQSIPWMGIGFVGLALAIGIVVFGRKEGR